VTLYAESSAVLAWLLGEPAGADARDALASADLVLTSELTLVECDRVLIRAVALGELSEVDAADRHADLNEAAVHWTILRPGAEVMSRARQRYPAEPVRTLDALHLASALLGRSAVSDTVVLSYDDAIRTNARALGFALRPVEVVPS
jgi:predicted nucleic acid-binding protein